MMIKVNLMVDSVFQFIFFETLIFLQNIINFLSLLWSITSSTSYESID